MTENIGTQFKVEGQPAFPTENTENDNSTDSSTETKTNADQTGSSDQNQNQTDDKSGGADNFADHPRWKERETDWTKRFNDQEERHTSELAKIRAEFLGSKGTDESKPAVPSNSPTQVPSWFGGDEQQWKEFSEWNNGLISQAETRGKDAAIKEIESKTKAEQDAIKTATTYFNEQVTAIETDKTLNPKGTKVDRNKLMKFVLDNELVDTKGRWNYRAGFQLMQGSAAASTTKTVNEKKQIASATTSENRAETKTPSFMTSEDFKKPANRPW